MSRTLLVLVPFVLFAAACEEEEGVSPADTAIAIEEIDIESEVLDSGLEEFGLEADFGDFCAAAPGAIGVTSTRSSTHCNEYQARSNARFAARAATDSRCRSLGVPPLGANQCSGNGVSQVSPPKKCGSETSRSETAARSGPRTCGVWPFRRSPWTATVSSTATCGWECSVH